LYQPFVEKTVEEHALKLLAADKRKIDEKVLEAVAVQYFQMKPEEVGKVKLSGQSILIANHIREYVVQLIKNDIKFTPFEVLSLEKEYVEDFEVRSGTRTLKIKVGGIIDRLDRTKDGIRIVDYKTGRNLKLDFKEWNQLTDRDSGDRRKEIFQTLIYSDILNRKESQPILPTIYKLDNLFEEEFDPSVVFQGTSLVYQRFINEFREAFSSVLSDIFNPEVSYDQVKDSVKCSYCPYNKICRR
jgi:hypothetical protein